MTYFGFLAIFLGIPLLGLSILTIFDLRRGYNLPAALSAIPFWLTVIIHVLVALVYTTPWDNYLVATGVWYYNPRLVTGITLGWVPIEEYSFFVLQTIVTGLWMRALAVRLPMPVEGFREYHRARKLPFWGLGVIWIAAAVGLVSGWQPGNYLNLILCWAIPPILMQIIFGGDILRYHWRFSLLALAVPTIYISLADSLAIGLGIWAIDPGQSVNLFLGGVLPLEEFIFFTATNTLICLGVILFQAPQSHERLRQYFSTLFSGNIRGLSIRKGSKQS
jgi:lycopene cyclase domain-containing protein